MLCYPDKANYLKRVLSENNGVRAQVVKTLVDNKDILEELNFNDTYFMIDIDEFHRLSFWKDKGTSCGLRLSFTDTANLCGVIQCDNIDEMINEVKAITASKEKRQWR